MPVARGFFINSSMSLCPHKTDVFCSILKFTSCSRSFSFLTEVCSNQKIEVFSSEIIRLWQFFCACVLKGYPGSFSLSSCCAETTHSKARGIIIWFQKLPMLSNKCKKSQQFSVCRLLLLCHLAATPPCIAMSPPMNVCKLLHEQTG